MTVPLLASSVLFGSILVGFIALYWSRLMSNWLTAFLSIIVLLGVLTSLLNHGTDLAAAKWIDRAFMIISGLVFFAALTSMRSRLYLVALMGAAIVMYAAAKIVGKGVWSDGFHIACHGFATVFIVATLCVLKDQQ
jgi:hypothetical protein